MNIDEAVRKCLRYEPETGLVYWNVSRGGRVSGQVAGCIRKNGYIKIRINKTAIFAHRIAWFLSYGYWPKEFIDHIDGETSNNRISNLREATNQQNHQNRKCHRKGKLVGTTYVGRLYKNPWQSAVRMNGIRKHLGCFPTEQEAHNAYVNAVKDIEGLFSYQSPRLKGEFPS